MLPKRVQWGVQSRAALSVDIADSYVDALVAIADMKSFGSAYRVVKRLVFADGTPAGEWEGF